MNKQYSDQCRKCGEAMKPGKALAQTFTGLSDFIGDTTSGAVVTVSPGGSGALVDCLKCETCGWSVSA